MSEEPASPEVALTWVKAPNPGPSTLEGTLTYLVSAARTVWIVDPGPAHRGHAQAVVDAAVATGARRVGGIVLTHRHEDHTGAVSMVRRALSAATGITVPLWAAEPGYFPGATELPTDLSASGVRAAEIIHLPGHTADSVGLLVSGGRMLTGDALLGGSPTTITADGNLRDHLQSLSVLRVMSMDGKISGLYPGHGRIIEGPHEALAEIEHQIAHREERIAQVAGARERGALTMKRLLDELYEPQFEALRREGASSAHIEALREAATQNIRAALDYLTAQ